MNSDLPRVDRERTENVKLWVPTMHPLTKQEAGQDILDKLTANFKASPQ